MPPILSLDHVSKTYDGAGQRLTVLDDVSLSVEEGSTLAVIGPSGSGKTTLLGLCAGLDRASAGRIELSGVRLDTLDEDARARVRNRYVGFIFQNFQLLPTLTALENVLVPLELRGAGAPRDRAVELLRKVGLGERLGHYPTQLSGGEQQRVALARAFVNRPQLLFADEPTGNLDGDTAHLVADMIFQLNADAGTALVLVTHDLELARRCRQLIRLKGGAVVS